MKNVRSDTSFTMKKDDAYYMKQALHEAMRAFEADEVPIGAVVVMENRIIARGFNQVQMLQDATAHAEMIALTSAFGYLGAKYVPGASLYVTLEPCVMCCGALFWSKISRVIYGASDDKFGGISKHSNLLHPKTQVLSGLLADECAQLMKDFFAAKRGV